MSVEAEDVAVIDVGSNSVRLVLYRVEGRAIWTVYNERVLAGLGREVTRTRRLSPEGVNTALAALRRFRAVLDGSPVNRLHTAATAAVREASDGAAFVARVREDTGLAIEVLSGEAEARASALGVLAGAPGSTGVVGDLGGSSLELTRIGGDEGPEIGPEIGAATTLPLGPFALGAGRDYDPARSRAEALRRLDATGDAFRSPTFHAVGGAWRNLALLHMRLTDYPLQVVHQYELSAAEALDFARLVARQSRGSLERIQGISKKRLETLPHAAILLETLIQKLGIERVAFSAHGLREGLIYGAMAPETRRRDPLVEGCASLGLRFGVIDALGPALEAWLAPTLATLTPLFPAGRDGVLAAAAGRLADIGARLHPDHRGALAFDQVLRAPIAGQSHAERAYLAAAVFTRYEAEAPLPEPVTISRVLSPERLQRARTLGLALRLGCDLSGRSPGLLVVSAMRVEAGALTLSVRPEAADLLLGDQARKRLAALGTHLGMTPVVVEPRRASAA